MQKADCTTSPVRYRIMQFGIYNPIPQKNAPLQSSAMLQTAMPLSFTEPQAHKQRVETTFKKRESMI